MKYGLFTKVAFKTLIGTFTGIITGAIFGLIIWALQIPLNWINDLLNFGQHADIIYSQQSIWPNASFPESLGMSFGAIIGSLMGGLSAFIEYRNEHKTKSEKLK